MELKLLPMAQTDIKNFKHDIQEAFQKGFEAVLEDWYKELEEREKQQNMEEKSHE